METDHSGEHRPLLTPLPSAGSSKDLLSDASEKESTRGSGSSSSNSNGSSDAVGSTDGSVTDTQTSSSSGALWPTVRSSAPGKVILFGEHSVVYGMPSVATAAGLRTTVAVSGDTNDHVYINFVNLQREFVFTVEQLAEIAPEFKLSHPAKVTGPTAEQLQKIEDLVEKDIHHGVTALLYLYLTITSSVDNIGAPYRFVIDSELPIGAGMGSSASFAVALVAALLSANGVYKCGGCDGCVAGDRLCGLQKALINDWAYQGEVIIHGKPSGIDNAVSCFGGALRFQAGEMKALEYVPAMRFLVSDTQVSRNTKALVAGVRERRDRLPKVIDPILAAMSELVEACIELFDGHDKGELDTATLEANLGELMEVNHQLLNALGVGHDALDHVCRLARSHGLRSKLTGAGGGGCALTLVPANCVHENVAELVHKLESEANCAVREVELGGPGVEVLRSDLHSVREVLE